MSNFKLWFIYKISISILSSFILLDYHNNLSKNLLMQLKIYLINSWSSHIKSFKIEIYLSIGINIGIKVTSLTKLISLIILTNIT